MSPSKKRILRILVVAVTSIVITILFVAQIDHDNIFDDEINILTTIIATPVLIIVFVKDLIEFKNGKSIFSLLPTFLIAFFLIGLSLASWEIKERDRSPVKFSCVTKVVDFNGISIDFREDGTYKICSWSLGADYYRGTYVLNDSIIILHNLPEKAPLQSNRLLIRSEMLLSNDTTTIESVYQIDKTGNVIENSTAFDVN